MKRILIATALVALILLLAVWLTTPWHVFPRNLSTNPNPDFAAEQIRSAHELRTQLRWLSLTPWLLTLAITLLLGVASVRSERFAHLLDTPARWGSLAHTYAIVAALSLVTLIVRLPFEVASLRLSRRVGLSTATWSTWIMDLVKSFALSVFFVGVALALLGWAARTWRNWWIPSALGAAGLAIVVSFLLPIIVEPIFNKFTPMPQGELRTSLLQLADRDEVRVQDVLVADASRRTTALNAYVSGFGATRRIVVYDTLLSTAPNAEIKSVVAHELGHAKRNDVFWGTLVGALGAALGVLLLALLLGARIGQPRFIPAVIAIITVMSVLQQPVASLVSRQIEMRADLHALQLTKDPSAFVDMQKRLAISNKADLLTPKILYYIFATHPSTMERISFARYWAQRNG